MKVREKKMSYADLEDHVIGWCVEELSAIRDSVADIEYDISIPSIQKELIFNSFAKTVESLINLISPFRHDESCLLEWAFNFVDEYLVFDDQDVVLS